MSDLVGNAEDRFSRDAVQFGASKLFRFFRLVVYMYVYGRWTCTVISLAGKCSLKVAYSASSMHSRDIGKISVQLVGLYNFRSTTYLLNLK